MHAEHAGRPGGAASPYSSTLYCAVGVPVPVPPHSERMAASSSLPVSRSGEEGSPAATVTRSARAPTLYAPVVYMGLQEAVVDAGAL